MSIPLLADTQAQFPLWLQAALPENQHQGQRLEAAWRYAVTNGGKRVRPALVMGAAQALGCSSLSALQPAAVAIELIHCYSLVHDDLPCMDDDDLRRGQPTCHKAFDEGTALLAGDALQSLAFKVLADAPLSAEIRLQQQQILTQAAFDMVVGQALDTESEGKLISLTELEYIHRHKTGALIRAAVQMGAVAAAANPQQQAALTLFADKLGLAFQVWDDVLDVVGDTVLLGKTAGSDESRAKATYPALLGLAEAKALAEQLHEQAISALVEFGEQAQPLRDLAKFLLHRQY